MKHDGISRANEEMPPPGPLVVGKGAQKLGENIFSAWWLPKGSLLAVFALLQCVKSSSNRKESIGELEREAFNEEEQP